jgi:subtilisin-like proprotein convertase family protein
VELEVGLTVEPNGLTYGLMADDLFWLQDVLLGGSPEEIEAALGHLSGDDQPVADGQTVTYTIHLHNLGSDPMTGLTADVTPRYGMRLLGNPCGVTDTHGLPDVGPGEHVTDTFTGLVDAACSSEQWAGIAVEVRGPSDELWDRLWAQHAVDQTPPMLFGIQQPRYVVGVGPNPVLGYAYDEAGIAEVGLEAQLHGEPAEIVVCPDNTPHDGTWACDWSVAADHGDTVSATLHVTDTLGQSAAWAKPLPFLVDARPPTLTFDVTSTQVVSGSLVRGAAFSVYGEVRDDGGVGTVDVCLDDNCAPATLLTTVGTQPLALEDAPVSPVAMSAGAPCITRTFTISEDFAIAEANLGVVISHAHRHDLQATLTSPRGATSAVLCGETDPANPGAHYDVSLGDSAFDGVYGGASDHDPGLPYYENVVRPCQPLRVFQGERSAGTWNLRICDLDPGAGEGAYRRGYLELTPRDAAPHASRWSHRTPAIPGSDWTTHTITIHAEDVVGNRTGDELSLVFTVDSEAPVITVTRVLTEMQLAETAALVQRVSHPDFLLGFQAGFQRMTASSTRTVMWATISDSGPAVGVSAHVHAPDGSTLREQVARSGDVYWLDLEPQQEGLHTLWLEAKDQAGNTSTAGPFDIEVLGRPEQEDKPQPVGGYAWVPGRSLLRLAALKLVVLTAVMMGPLLVGATVLRRSRRRR